MVISRKRGECVRIGEDLHVYVLRTGADVVLQLRGKHRATFTLQRGQVRPIAADAAIKVISVGLEPTLYFLVSEGIPVVRCELLSRPSAVEMYRQERRKRQQCAQGQPARDEPLSPPESPASLRPALP